MSVAEEHPNAVARLSMLVMHILPQAGRPLMAEMSCAATRLAKSATKAVEGFMVET